MRVGLVCPYSLTLPGGVQGQVLGLGRALRDLGVKEVPCLIQKAVTRQELKSVAVGNLRKHADLYLKEPRPPVLKDYFDSRLCQKIRVPPVQRQVKIRFTVESYDVVQK